jgi:integrase/recombinase XerD
MANFSTAIILETRTPRKDGAFPVKLRVIIERKARYYHLDEYLTQDEFLKVFSPKPRDQFKKIAQRLNENEKRAIKTLETMETPNFDQFKRLFTFKGSGGNVKKYYQAYIKACKQDNRHGTASNYECSLNSLDEVKGIENANFRDVTPAWLKDYTNKMKASGKSISTIGAYLRPLRFLFNRALKDGVISESHYPFGKAKYQIPASERNKRPLERSELETLANYSGNPINEMYRDFFLLSYYLVGLNFMDLLTLKWNQFDRDIITVVRKKTERTTEGNQHPISYFVNDEAREIINKHGNPAGTYIFNIISEKDSPQETRRKVQNFNRNTNQALKAIAKKNPNISQKISTVFARHSAASHSLASGATLAEISEALGHTNIQTTSSYISSLGNKQALSNNLKLKTSVTPDQT